MSDSLLLLLHTNALEQSKLTQQLGTVYCITYTESRLNHCT